MCFLQRDADTPAHAIKCQEEVVSGGKHPSGRGGLRFRQRERTPALDIQVDLLDLERLPVRLAEQRMRQDYPGLGSGALIACTLTLVRTRPWVESRGFDAAPAGPGSKHPTQCPHHSSDTIGDPASQENLESITAYASESVSPFCLKSLSSASDTSSFPLSPGYLSLPGGGGRGGRGASTAILAQPDTDPVCYRRGLACSDIGTSGKGRAKWGVSVKEYPPSEAPIAESTYDKERRCLERNGCF